MLRYQKISFLLLISLYIFLSVMTVKTQSSLKEISQHFEGIQATVIGKLNFQEGRGYYIVTKQSKNNWETKVWLRISEDKVLGRKLENLLNKIVKAKGELGQIPENVTASTPRYGIYIQDFEIEKVNDEDSNLIK